MSQFTGEWPGTQMTDQGNGIWSYVVPAEATTVIFNNGSDQTADLTIPADGSNLYDPSTKTWSVYGTTPDNPGTGSDDDQDLSVFYGTRTDFRDESVYTLLISRFYDGDSGNNVHCWDDSTAGNPDSDPAWRGDFKGLIEKLDYIKALGFTAVRLNPVVQNASGYDYHGFHPINLKEIDFRLESDGYTYEDLIDACHARGLKVIQVVNLNNTSNFGEEYLRKLFELDEEADWSVTESLIPTETLLEQYPNYAELTPNEQYQARLNMLKAHITETLNADEHYHRETQMGYETYLEEQGQAAGDCVDINTENPEVALYLAESCAWYAQMGVDAIFIDNAKYINRWTFNEGILPLLNDLLEEAGLELDIFCEIESRARETWNQNNPSSSVPFYTWAETEEDWQDNWVDDDPTANIQTSINHYNAHDTTEKFEIPTSDNALLNGITYHKPDYSQSNGMHAFDFTMMWNFEKAGDAFRSGVAGDKYMNDATWNLLSVDNWDYGPDQISTTRYSLGVDAWKQNLNLMFTFRGIPSILYGSEIEFAKDLPLDVGTTQPLANTGRAYYGDHLEGTVTATDFGEYEASGEVADTLNSELSQHIRMLNGLRQKIPALRKGQYTTNSNYVSGNMAFIRRYTNKSEDIDSLALVALSGGATFWNIPNGKYVDAVSGNEINVTNGTLLVPDPGSVGLAVYVCCEDGFTGLDAELPAAESVLRFNVDGDTTVVDAITTKNGEAVLPTAPEPPVGYTFFGWIVNGEEYQPGETVAISVDSMARADLRELTCTVTFVWNGAQGTEDFQNVAKDAKVTAPSIPEYDGYRFMGWFADEALTDEWDMDSDTVTGDISLYAKWMKKENVSVGGDETVTPDVVVDDTTAIIQPTEEEIDRIVENSRDDETIVIDLSGLDDTVSEVQIPQKLISEIVDSMKDPETETEYLEIVTPTGTVKLDKDALETLSEHEETGVECALVLVFDETEHHELTEAQQDVLEELNVCGRYEVYAECTVSGRVHFRETGVAELGVPFAIPDGTDADEYTVWYVSEDGELEKLTTWYEDGYIYWSVNHFSDFVIIYEESEGDSFDSDLWHRSLMMLFNQEFSICASASEGGTITPAGTSVVKYDKNLTYTITPDEGYEISAVLVDGKDIGAVSEYTFKRVKKDHTVTAVFEKIKWQNPFTDVNEADWFYEDVQFVSETGLMNGTAETKFSPDTALTRAMLVTVLWRLEGEPVVNYVMPFSDVADGEWYTEAVRWAAAEGIVNGYEDSIFRHGNEITREQTMAILHRYAAYKGLDSGMIFPMIPQYDYSLWAENDIIWADMVGLTSGIGKDIFDMTACADRAEIAAYLRRFCEAFLEE